MQIRETIVLTSGEFDPTNLPEMLADLANTIQCAYEAGFEPAKITATEDLVDVSEDKKKKDMQTRWKLVIYMRRKAVDAVEWMQDVSSDGSAEDAPTQLSMPATVDPDEVPF